MLECPACRATTDSIHFSAWVVRVEGYARIDSLGRITQVSPLRATTTIKIGHEIEGHHTHVVCQACGFSGALKEYTLIASCALTGKRADVTLKTSYGDIPISSHAIEQARFIFTDDALSAQELFRGNI
jgi:hypothetical protein